MSRIGVPLVILASVVMASFPIGYQLVLRKPATSKYIVIGNLLILSFAATLFLHDSARGVWLLNGVWASILLTLIIISRRQLQFGSGELMNVRISANDHPFLWAYLCTWLLSFTAILLMGLVSL